MPEAGSSSRRSHASDAAAKGKSKSKSHHKRGHGKQSKSRPMVLQAASDTAPPKEHGNPSKAVTATPARANPSPVMEASPAKSMIAKDHEGFTTPPTVQHSPPESPGPEPTVSDSGRPRSPPVCALPPSDALPAAARPVPRAAQSPPADDGEIEFEDPVEAAARLEEAGRRQRLRAAVEAGEDSWDVVSAPSDDDKDKREETAREPVPAEPAQQAGARYGIRLPRSSPDVARMQGLRQLPPPRDVAVVFARMDHTLNNKVIAPLDSTMGRFSKWADGRVAASAAWFKRVSVPKHGPVRPSAHTQAQGTPTTRSPLVTPPAEPEEPLGATEEDPTAGLAGGHLEAE